MKTKMTVQTANLMLDNGFHCSQVIMLHIAENISADKNLLLRITEGLGGGCFHGDTCGVITAGSLAIGMFFGSAEPDELCDNLVVNKVQEYECRFAEIHGSVLCRYLLKDYDFALPDQEDDDDTFANCGIYCADACTILDSILKL